MRIDGKTQRQIVIEFTLCYLTSDATIIDIMEWMINTQLGRRNLPPAQRLAVVEKFKKKIQEEAKEKYDATVGRPSKENRSPNGEQLNNKILISKHAAILLQAN